jgi:hypothetical protein
MVWLRMGLLDDAIREHLELKRQRGADPDEVAREQREALEPIVRGNGPEEASLAGEAVSAAPLVDPPAPAPVDTASDLDPVAVDQQLQPSAQAPAGTTSPEEHDDPQASTGSSIGGETVELDMSSVFSGDEPAGEVGHAGAETAPPADVDSLEWEMPSDSSDAEGEGGEDESAEDVLEETPDFLRDTPEQDRLWFEQRPPRDFDFDK